MNDELKREKTTKKEVKEDKNKNEFFLIHELYHKFFRERIERKEKYRQLLEEIKIDLN